MLGGVLRALGGLRDLAGPSRSLLEVQALGGLRALGCCSDVLGSQGQLARAGLGGGAGTARGQAGLGTATRAAARLAGCCCLSARRACSRSSRFCVAASWLVPAPAGLAGLLSSWLCRRGGCCRGAPPLPPVLWSYPGLISRAMGERDELLLPWRTPAGSVVRCAPLAAESAQGARAGLSSSPGPRVPLRCSSWCGTHLWLPCRLDDSGPD